MRIIIGGHGHDHNQKRIISIQDLEVVENNVDNVSGRPFSDLEETKQRQIVEKGLRDRVA